MKYSVERIYGDNIWDQRKRKKVDGEEEGEEGDEQDLSTLDKCVDQSELAWWYYI